MYTKYYTKNVLREQVREKIVVCIDLLDQSIEDTRKTLEAKGRKDILFRLEQLDGSLIKLRSLSKELEEKIETDDSAEVDRLLSLISHISNFICEDMASIIRAESEKYLH